MSSTILAVSCFNAICIFYNLALLLMYVLAELVKEKLLQVKVEAVLQNCSHSRRSLEDRASLEAGLASLRCDLQMRAQASPWSL